MKVQQISCVGSSLQPLSLILRPRGTKGQISCPGTIEIGLYACGHTNLGLPHEQTLQPLVHPLAL